MDGTAGSPLSTRSPRSRLLVVPLVAWFVASTVSVAFAPALLERAPVVLVLLAPFTRHLVLVAPLLDPVSFFLAGLVGLLFPDPFAYLLGQKHGEAAVEWIEKKSGAAGAWVRFMQRLFRRAAPLVLFVSPGPFVNLLAGVARMRPAVWLGVNLAGTLCFLGLVRWFGAALAEPIGAARAFIEANVIALTAISAVLVVVGAVVRRRRIRQALEQNEKIRAAPPQ